MRKFIDLTGQVFGKLTVIKQVETNKYGHICWLCECSCDNHTQTICTASSLRRKRTKSCGCIKREAIIEYNKKHKRKYNIYNLTGEFGIGYSSNNNDEFYFDLEDYEKIKDYCWHKTHKGYIETIRNKKCISLHKFILNNNIGVIDHLNRNKTDNRKENLAIKSHQENMKNQNVRKNNNSGVAGVTWDIKKNKWHSYIMNNGKLQHLGYYTDKDEAILNRLKKEKEYGYLGENKSLWEKYNIIGE